MSEAPTPTETAECIHGMEREWCSICRKADGYRPGSDRQANDCTVMAFVNLTGADYTEAETITAEHGRRPGKGMVVADLHAALASVGYAARPVSLDLHMAVAASRQGRAFHVTAARNGRRHSWAIVDGKQINGWTATRSSMRYSIYEVS